MTYLDKYLEEHGYRRLTEIDLQGNKNIKYSSINGMESIEITQTAYSLENLFDPLPYARAEAKVLIKSSEKEKRLQYVTDAAGKDVEYEMKRLEALQYNIDQTVGQWMQTRINKTGEPASVVASIWNARSTLWIDVGARISAIVDHYNILIDAETIWSNCITLASLAVAEIEAI